MNVLVTGASRGIGKEFTRRLSGQGHSVYATVRKASDIDGELAQAGVEYLLCDVTEEADLQRLADSLSSTSLDLLINNAGILRDG